MNVNNEKLFHPREVYDYVGGIEDSGGGSTEKQHSEWTNDPSSIEKKYTHSVFLDIIIGSMIGCAIALIILSVCLPIIGIES